LTAAEGETPCAASGTCPSALRRAPLAASLPHAAPGQAVSLRVQATDAGGSGIEQTIMTAYHG
jgi:hypothetical protein